MLCLQQVLTARLEASGGRGMENLVSPLKPGVGVVQGLPSVFHLCLRKQLVEIDQEAQLSRDTFQIRLEVRGWKRASVWQLDN